MILIIESSAKFCSVAIASLRGENVYSEKSDIENSHAEKLPIMVQKALEFASENNHEILAIGVSKGPGSYTGLRIGASLAKGLCFANRIPLIALNSLLGMVNHVKEIHTAQVYFSHLDARRNEIYVQGFNEDLGEIMHLQALILDENTFEMYKQQSILICGNSNAKIEQICALSHTTKYIDMHPSAEYLCQEAALKYTKQAFENLAYFEPLYLKDFIPGITKKSGL